jgi:hypothetical protein
MRSAAATLLKIAPRGWLISWAIEPVSSPATASLMARARSSRSFTCVSSARRRRRRSISKTAINMVRIKNTIAARITSRGCASHKVGSLNCTIASLGNDVSPMPQRLSWRQSTFNVLGMTSGRRSEAGVSPLSNRPTTTPACRPMPRKFGMRPPTMPVPMNVLNEPNIGAVEAVAMISADSRGVKLRPSPSLK